MAMSGDRMLGDAWVLVVEDEDRLRHDLVSLLNETAADLGAVIPASTAEQAQSLCQAWCAPAVAFLDIQLPGRSGLDLVQTLPAHTRVVFITAYDRFAIDAFDRGAVDYLLKPVAAERLQRCLSRLRSRAVPAAHEVRQILSTLTAMRPAQHLNWLAASSGRRTRLIAVDQITYLQSDNKYTRVVSHDGEHLLEESLRSLLPRLDPANFCQIHRSTAVHLREVLLVEKDDTGGGMLHLRSRPDVLRISAPFMREFKRFLV
jgi:DNA-binding LytR/AlgR family response regulator